MGDEVKQVGEATITKRQAALEVARWVLRLRNASIGGIVLMFLMNASEGYAFIITAGGLGFFAMYLGMANKMLSYLKQRYGI